jgi:hypothetical protein
MNSKKIFTVKAVTYIITFVVGVTGGYYVYLGLNYNVEALAIGAIVLAFLTWLGSGTDLLQFFLNLIDRYRQEQKDIEYKKREHYERDIRDSVFNAWSLVKNDLTTRYQDYPAISFPIYLNVKSFLLNSDRFFEAVDHINSGYKTENIFTVYNKIIELENTHNSKVSSKINAIETKIKSDIANETKLSEFDRTNFSLKPPYYLYETIVQYIETMAQNNSIILEIRPYDDYPELRIKNGDQIASGDENDLQWLKQYLEDLLDEIKTVKTFYDEIKTMNDLVESQN